MDQASYPVDILDVQGQVVSQKARYEVDKRIDIFHGVHVVLVTPKGELVVSLIPERDDLPNLYAGLLGTTMATIRRHGETAKAAATRGLGRELLIEKPKLELVHDGLVKLSDGRWNYLTVYLTVAERPVLYRLLDIGELVVIMPEGITTAMEMHADQFAPTLKAVWPELLATYASVNRKEMK